MARALHPALRWTGAGQFVRRLSKRTRGGPSRVLLLDVAPAAVMTAFLCFVSPLALSDDGANAATMDAGAYALCVAAGGAFLVRRRLPLLMFAVALVTTLLFAVLYDGGPIFMAALLALLALVVSRPAAVWVPATLGGAVALVIAQALSDDGTSLGGVVIAAVWIGSAVATAEIVRLRGAEMSEALARAELAERSREEEGARRVA